MQKIKSNTFNGTKALTFVAILLSIIHMTDIDNSHFFSSLSNTAIVSQIIPIAADAVKSSNTTTIDIRAGSGLASSATPLHPSLLHINTGDTVIWVNNDNVNHSINSLLFNSGIIWPKASGHGPSTFSYTFNQTGAIVYVDRLHPYLGGVIYVGIPTTQRELISTTSHFVNVKIEMPQNAAYKSNYGGFFIPAGTQVPLGTKLTWSNKDYVAHTATSSDGSTFDTKTILPGTSLTITLQHKGVFPYYCKIHPWMMGAIVVS